MGIGKLGVNIVETAILESGHIFQKIDGDADVGIDGYIRLRKLVTFKKKFKRKAGIREEKVTDKVDTGAIVGIQIKTVSSIPAAGSNSYYYSLPDKTKFAVNFTSKEALDSKRIVWQNFIGPVILILVDLETKKCWWSDVNDMSSYDPNYDYMVIMDKSRELDFESFVKIRRLGGSLFAKKPLITIVTNQDFFNHIGFGDTKQGAKTLYYQYMRGGSQYPVNNAAIGDIMYTKSGWKHITRFNRLKTRIINSLTLLQVSKAICERVSEYSNVQKGQTRQSKQFVKKVEFLTLRANVTYDFREASIVQVVLRRIKTYDKLHPTKKIPDQLFFHSVYEPYRKE